MTATAAQQLRYRQRSATYGDLAYDLDRELRERELRHAGELPRRREQAVAAPKVRSVSKPLVREKQRLSLTAALGFLLAAALAVMTLLYYVELTSLSNDVVTLNKELSQLRAENVTLTAQHEQMFDLTTVREAAEAAGMSKPSNGQTYCMDLSDGDNAVVYQKEEPGLLVKLMTSLDQGFYTMMEYFG